MPFPRLHDDGAMVTLDLHGASVDEALDLAEALVVEAARRGRSTVRLVHGASTSDARYRNRTIKHGLYGLLDAGVLDPLVTGALRGEGTLTLSLDVTRTPDASPITLADLR